MKHVSPNLRSAIPRWGRNPRNSSGSQGRGASLQFVRPNRYNIRSSYDQGFRAPNLQETTGLGHTGDRFEVPNPGLRPVRSNTFELEAAVLNLSDYRYRVHASGLDAPGIAARLGIRGKL